MGLEDDFDQAFAAYRVVFDNNEGLCEVGLFGLTSEAWTIFERKKFTQWGTAVDWARYHFTKLIRQKRFQKFRMSVVAEPDTLDGVLAEYEEKRKAGEAGFTPRRNP